MFMELHDPVIAYNAAGPEEAELVCAMLNEMGIPAMLIDDSASPGLFAGAGLDARDQPQVWISRGDAERAIPLLAQYDNHAMRVQAEARLRELESAAPIEIICSECGYVNEYPAALIGTVQECVRCGCTLDVGLDSTVADWGWDMEDAEDETKNDAQDEES